MKKINIKRMLLYISLIPYIYVLIMCIYHAIFGFSYDLIGWPTEYGINGAVCFLDDFWLKIVSDFDYKLFLILLCISYQIYYVLTNKKHNQEESLDNEQRSNLKNKKSNLKKLAYIISITCWIIYFMSGIYAFFFGSNTGGGLFNPEMEYGIDALSSTLILNLLKFSFIPVLPITLIYIIIYSITSDKKIAKGKEVK